MWASLLMKRTAIKRQLNHLCSGRSLGFCLPLANYLVSFPHLTCPRALLNMCAHLFAKIDSSTEACGRFDITYYGVALPPFRPPQGAFLCLWRWGSLLDRRSGHLVSLLQQSSTPATNLVFGMSGKTELQFTLLGQLQLSSQGALLPPTTSLSYANMHLALRPSVTNQSFSFICRQVLEECKL